MNIREKLQHWKNLANIGKKPRTQHYHSEIEKIILAEWPNLEQDAETVTEPEIAAFAVKVAHYSAPRFNAIVSALKSMIPAAKILKRRSVVIKERANISQREFKKLLEELDSNPRSHGGLIVRFLAQTGLRINEARQLRWHDVRLDHIHAPASITKNGKARFIPFVPGLADTIARLRTVGSREFILPQAEVKRALKTACARVGLPGLSHHDFRHMYATRCIESGVDIPTAARWLGHQDGGSLLGKVYFHLGDRHSKEMASKVRI